jgi:N-glycosidase YbiA
MKLNVAIFTFNTDAQIFCCSCEKKESCGLGRKFLKFVGIDCIRNDFVKNFIKYIYKKNNNQLPDLFVINLQESSIVNISGGPKSDQLLYAFKECINEYSNDKYNLFPYKLEGIGSENSKSLCTGLFFKLKLITNLSPFYFKPTDFTLIAGQPKLHFRKGAILLNTDITNGEEKYYIHFINTYLPFLSNEKDLGKKIRDETINETLDYFKSKVNEFYKDKLNKSYDFDNKNIAKFIIGDLNYRMHFEDDKKKEEFIKKLDEIVGTYGLNKAILQEKFLDFLNNKENNYKQFDQLKQTNSNLKNYNEGINNAGPNFLPTCRLKKICSKLVEKEHLRPYEERFQKPRPYEISTGKNERVPSWCDRILYSGNKITCKLYEQYDNTNTCKSDHAPVIGLYEIESTTVKEITSAQPVEEQIKPQIEQVIKVPECKNLKTGEPIYDKNTICFGDDEHDPFVAFTNSYFIPDPKNSDNYKPIIIDGKSYPTVEHYYQSQKFAKSDPSLAEAIKDSQNPLSLAKTTNQQVNIDCWIGGSTTAMFKALMAKFNQNPSLKKLLIDTDGKNLVYHVISKPITKTEIPFEGKDFSDNGTGESPNRLGIMLMLVRDWLKSGGKEDKESIKKMKEEYREKIGYFVGGSNHSHKHNFHQGSKNDVNYYQKYIKYKQKYLNLKHDNPSFIK